MSIGADSSSRRATFRQLLACPRRGRQFVTGGAAAIRRATPRAPPCRSWASRRTSAQPAQKATTAYADQRWCRAGPFASTARTLPTIASGHHDGTGQRTAPQGSGKRLQRHRLCAPTGQRDDEQRRQPADRHRVARADLLPGVPEGLTDQPGPDVHRDPGRSANHLLCGRADEKEAEQVDGGAGHPAVLHHEGGDPSPQLALQRGRRSLQRCESARHRLLDHESDQRDGGDQSRSATASCAPADPRN